MAHDDTPIQIVDGNDQVIGAASMDEARAKGLIHRITRVMVEDPDGRILLQLRQANKFLYPNCWDPSAAGHVDEGETYEQAAAREMEEEIGISGLPLTEIGYYESHSEYNGRKLNRFNKLYKVVVPADTEFKIQKDEVAGVQWFTLDEVKKLVYEQPAKVSDGLQEAITRFY